MHLKYMRAVCELSSFWRCKFAHQPIIINIFSVEKPWRNDSLGDVGFQYDWTKCFGKVLISFTSRLIWDADLQSDIARVIQLVDLLFLFPGRKVPVPSVYGAAAVPGGGSHCHHHCQRRAVCRYTCWHKPGWMDVHLWHKHIFVFGCVSFRELP